MSQTFGPATLTLGYGRGDRLNGVYGGGQLELWNTGISLLGEDDAATPYVGARYQSPAIKWLADASIVGTVTRSLRNTNGVLPRTSFSINIQIPLGKRFNASRCDTGLCGNAKVQSPTDTAEVGSFALQRLPDAPLPSSYPPVHAIKTAATPPSAQMPTPIDKGEPASLDTIVGKLVAAGLERVRAGMNGDDLIVEYENHRYNQNEADALGIVLGVASTNAPANIERIHAVIKKNNEAMGEVTVARSDYTQFIAGGSPTAVSASLTMRTRPTFSADSIAWVGNARSHGWVRLQVAPVTNYLYGTEYGVFDTSVGVAFKGFVPLWRGGELFATYIAPIYNSRNLDNGQVFSRYRLRGGLSDAALAQTFWVAPEIVNVAAVGKFDYHYLGVENETTLFVPGRPDIVRLRLAYLHREPGQDWLPPEKNALLTYRWVAPAWKMWVEAGVARYVDGDKGPLVTLTRWFDDVSIGLHAEHSGLGTFVGATISFPLTPRQGMKPGIAQVEGAQQFALDFRTRVGSVNYLNESNSAENLGFAYSTQTYLLNDGRFSAEYFSTQLYRMRDAYLRYAPPAGSASERGTDIDETALATVSTQPAGACPNETARPAAVICKQTSPWR